MLLKELTHARGVSGNEKEIREKLKALAEERGATCRVDRLGNLIAEKPGDAALPRLLLAAHMDEVGMLVTGARDDGLLRYDTVGGIDPRVAVSKRVECGDKRIPGVIGAKAIHLQTEDDYDRVLDHDNLFIDIGAKDKAEAEKLVPPGTFVCFDSPLTEIGEGRVVSRALDDRVGCLNLLRALEAGYPGTLICAFTVQEEVGLRGATALGHALDYDLAIALEGTTCNDLGDIPFEKQVCTLGEGVAISAMDRSSIAHARLKAAMERVGTEAGVKWQPKRAVAGGNDAGALQRGAGAKPTLTLSVPCRYIHSPNSVAALSDIEAQGALVEAFMRALPGIYHEISEETIK